MNQTYNQHQLFIKNNLNMKIIKSLLFLVAVLLLTGFVPNEVIYSEDATPSPCVSSEINTNPENHSYESAECVEYGSKSAECNANEEVLFTDELSYPCAESLCLKGIRHAQKVRCSPGERKAKVIHEYCKGTGYVLNYNIKCGTCSGDGEIYTQEGCMVCYTCCGDGRKVDKLCRGKGWIWQCISQR